MRSRHYIVAAALTVSLGFFSMAANARDLIRSDLGYPPGTIVIVNSEHQLYFIAGKGKAIRYPVATGKPSQVWTGATRIAEKKEDPTWLNPDDPTAEVVEGGDPKNPLGVRAMYLGNTLYRIHGTPKASSIGQSVSNGCIRMFNADVKDLYKRVRVGTPVVAINSQKAAGKIVRHAPKPVHQKLYLADKKKTDARKKALLAQQG